MDSVDNAALSVPEELQRILASSEFSRSERLRRFLSFVVEQAVAGKADQLKETVIGIEVFGRRPGYDPRSDPVVRVEAAKLRSRLAEYYDASGMNDPLRIEIPKGGYVPQWRITKPAPLNPISVSSALAHPRLRWKLGLAFTLAICLVGVALLRLKVGAVKANASSSQAYVLYMKGRAGLDGRTNRTAQALEYFEQAADLSPNNPMILAGTADALVKMDQEHQMVHEEAFSRAKAAAEKAVRFGPQSSEAYAALGVIRAQEYRWGEAERMLRHAIELKPDNIEAHTRLGFQVLLAERRMDEAIEELRHAVTLDPLSAEANLQLAYGLLWAGRWEEAGAQARKMSGLDPGVAEPYAILGQALYWNRDYDGALAALQEAVQHAPGGTSDHWLACGEVRAGHPEEARRLLADNLPGGQRKHVPDRRLLIFYACLGDKEKAFDSLERTYEQRDPSLAHFLLYPELDGLRSDPRFTALLTKIDLNNRPE